MIKLLVISTLNMTEEELEAYASHMPERAKDIKPEKFIEDIKLGKRIVVEYPDKTITSYELIVDHKN